MSRSAENAYCVWLMKGLPLSWCRSKQSRHEKPTTLCCKTRVDVYSKNSYYDEKNTNIMHQDGTCGPIPWFYLPLVVGIIPVIGLAITYLIAKRNCHVERWIFPYVSYTGTEYPESMIFGLLLNMEGFSGLVVVFIAWRYYRHMGVHDCTNTATLVLGSLSCFGVIIVGNFPVTKAKFPHYIGAAMAFIVGTFYTVGTAALSRRSYQQSDLKYVTHVKNLRIAIAAAMITSLVSLTCTVLYKQSLDKSGVSDNKTTTRLENGTCLDLVNLKPPFMRYLDLISALTEWLLTAGIIVCLSLYTVEFKAFERVKVVLLSRGHQLTCDNNKLRRETDENGDNDDSERSSRADSSVLASPGSPPSGDRFALLPPLARGARSQSGKQSDDGGCERSLADLKSGNLSRSLPDVMFVV